ncbi:hypothetical protein CCACVL1_01973 [Corchorus capsularis]|uniref:Uncharacterized protein n=1 Tax=Corchorus capsularis TaxID=210143 RepID=A0A1R3KDW1_COCAP|nr:hypothetical protein CCACVL1_01973 [Corchorus capsularis]
MAGVHSFDFLGLGYRVDWPVKDMMDLESVHMAYLTDSLHMFSP